MDHVLFVDDEINILSSIKRGLIDEDYVCYFAASGKEALEIMEKQEMSVICTDMRMPAMDGLALLKIAKDKYPRTVRVVLSGYTQLQQVIATVNQADIFKFITKPWKLEGEFKAVIRQAIEYFRLQSMNEELRVSLENKNIAYQNILKRIDDVISSTKADALSLREASLSTVNFLESLFEGTTASAEGIMRTRATAEIFRKAVNLAFMDTWDTNIREMVEQLANQMKFNRHVSKIDVISQMHGKTLPLKQDIIPFLFSIVENSFFFEGHKYCIKLACEAINPKGEEEGIRLTFLILPVQEDRNVVSVNFNKIDENALWINGVVNNIVNCCNAGISCTRVESNLGVKISLYKPGFVRSTGIR